MDIVKNRGELVENGRSPGTGLLLDLYNIAIKRVQPEHLIKDNITFEKGRILKLGYNGKPLGLDFSMYEHKFEIAIGKAALPMAEALVGIVGKDRFAGRVALVPKGSAPNGSNSVEVLEGTHPVFSEDSLKATERILELLKRVGPDDLVVLLVSGGASALFEKQADGIGLDEHINFYKELLMCGADIDQVNAIRKRTSLVKGGKLLHFMNGATVVALYLSDVPSDQIDMIASGPTAPDSTNGKDALKYVRDLGLSKRIAKNELEMIKSSAKAHCLDTPRWNSPLFEGVTNIIVGSNRLACEAVAASVRASGGTCYNIGSSYQGSAEDIAKNLAAFLKQIATTGLSGFEGSDMTIVCGFEGSVKVKGNRPGGRIQHMGAVMAKALNGVSGVTVLLGTTDGKDGTTDVAAVLIDEEVIKRMNMKRIDPADYIKRTDTHAMFNKIPGSQVFTGPTSTNVSDLMIARIVRRQA
ncbi:MAG: DUF4147 domain-containing protein [Candidatus Micrarchaeota archaeon]|nr:DUF4147 domain-containing protein [Candidatus Micrarchaeota archaeon]